MYGQGLLLRRVMGNRDDATTVLKEVFKDREVCLVPSQGQPEISRARGRGGGNEKQRAALPDLVMYLAPRLIINVVVLETLQAIDTNVEVRCVENCDCRSGQRHAVEVTEGEEGKGRV